MYWRIGLGIFLILFSVPLLFHLMIPALVMGLMALAVGIMALVGR